MNQKIGAIWARISRKGQSELSLDGQVARVKARMEALDYFVPPEYILAVDWTSMDLFSCPEMKKLRRWIVNREIQGLGTFDRDRLQAIGLQRLIFLAECKENGLELVLYQGSPLLEEPEGQLVELALAIGKERSVLRAQQGARDGLRDRAKKLRLPPCNSEALGYRWDGKVYLPDEHYPIACDIWHLALNAAKLTVRGIAGELTRRGIPTLRHKRVWNPSSIDYILHNPIYAGRIAALRHEVVEPRERRATQSGKPTYGKSSYRLRPEKEWEWLEGLVAQPVVTWEEFQWVQQRLELNGQYAKREGRGYLLRGLIECQLCHRRYIGKSWDSYWIYCCRGKSGIPWGAEKCPSRDLNGRKVEDNVWHKVTAYLLTPEVYIKELEVRARAKEYTKESLERTLTQLRKRLEANVDAEQEAFRQRIRGKVAEEVYEREMALMRAERTWLSEEMERQQQKLEQVSSLAMRGEAITAMAERLKDKLERASLDDKRFVLESLGVKVLSWGDGTYDIELHIPLPPVEQAILSKSPGGYRG